MLNTVVKLTSPRNLETFFKEEEYDNETVIVRPTYMSICAADQRYYQGKRKKEVLDKKLPLALIHESVGEVIYDPKKKFKKGTKVVMIPNSPTETNEIIKENYLRSSKFRSSSSDGFMQNAVFMKRDRIIPIGNIKESIASQLEIISVAVNAIETFLNRSHKKMERIGVWGCGSVGYIQALVLKKYFPDSKIIVVGTRREKLNYFSFADETLLNTELGQDFKVDHAFECVGGPKAEEAINQMIDVIEPQGTISLLGVTEDPVDINTRMILEKGITITGNSRSSYSDFAKSIEILQDEEIQEYVSNIISEYIDVNNVADINKAFDNDSTNEFKTVMKWNL